MMTDVVKGCIIGEVTQQHYYRFFDPQSGEKICDAGWFDDDEQAIAWFKKTHPTAFSKGAEMRCYD